MTITSVDRKLTALRGGRPAVGADRRRARTLTFALCGMVAGLGAAMSGCAYSAFEGPYGTDPDAVARGAALAQQKCGGCHGLGLTGASNYPKAPPFRRMRFDYNAISYERATARWHGGGAGMPPGDLTDAEVGAIGAYVRGLEHAGR